MYLFKLSLFLLMLLLPTTAFAQLPQYCYVYGLDDSFEGSEANSWIPWNNSQSGVIDIGSTNSARSGNNATLFSFANSETVSPNNFLIIDKLFHISDAETKKRRNRYGCSHVIPWVPSGEPEYCNASVWVKSAGDGAYGYLQLIDPNTYNIIATTIFNNSSPGTWLKVSIPSTTACMRYMLVRVALVRASTSSDAMVVDDLHIDWYF